MAAGAAIGAVAQGIGNAASQGTNTGNVADDLVTVARRGVAKAAYAVADTIAPGAAPAAVPAVAPRIATTFQRAVGALQNIATQAHEALLAGRLLEGKRLISRLERKCFQTLLLTQEEENELRSFANENGLRSFNDVIRWVKDNVTYNIDFAGDYSPPTEILIRRSGVCLEFATLTFALSNVLLQTGCQIVIGRRRRRHPESCHAWVEYEDHPYEPQSGQPVVYGEENGYTPWFVYNASESKVVDQATYDAQALARFIRCGGNCPKETDFPLSFIGLWEDNLRGFRVLPDYSVHFEWSKVRDVKTFRATQGVVDKVTGTLNFTLTFPPDSGNPDGRSYWHLHADGQVDVCFDSVMPNGQVMSANHFMRFRGQSVQCAQAAK
eukprot:TRINITY_DN64782_c0_g1_i1.p1 TRINITY_DN64782_c0_g1~~TRINITY_DN64782_c0_g1_i1.p1  ORF type:complete len:419 (-),score=58.28 TRINITY_DN64782_c0_g1_i1:190-1332(-)